MHWQGTFAAHFLRMPKARTMGSGILSRSPPISKFCSDLWVWAPHNLQNGSNGISINRASNEDSEYHYTNVL